MRRNYQLGMINGIAFTVGEALSSPSLVLALLIRQLGGSLTLVGLLPALQSGGYLLPQLLVGGRIQAMPRKLWVYQRAAFVRVAVYVAMLAAIFAAASVPAWLSLWLIVGCFSVFNFAGGTSTLAFQDVVAKVIPPRRRGSFFGTRQLVGGLLSFLLVGPLVGWLLGARSPLPFPYNYGALCLLGLFGIGSGLLAFALVTEPPATQVGARTTLAEALRRAPALLREHATYRWFIISRVLTRFALIAEPFYIIYAIESLGLPAGVAGIYLAVRAITGALSNLVWSRVSERSGNERLVRLSGVLVALTPLLALAGPSLIGLLGLGSLGLQLALGLVFLSSGAAADASNLAGSTYLLEIVPAGERPTYIGLANTIMGLATFVPVLGGALVPLIGYVGTFAVGLLFALLALLASLRLGRAA